jgi:hypothetical protein
VRYRIEECATVHLEAVRRFNERLGVAGVEFRIGEPRPAVSAETPIAKRSYVVLEGAEIRGGYILQAADCWVGGRLESVCNIQTPISEGLADRRYAGVASVMMRAIRGAYPLAFAVGMGGPQQPFPRLLKASGWSVDPVPFVFWPARPGRVLRGLPLIRRTLARRLAASLASFTGLPWLGLRVRRMLAAAPSVPCSDVVVEITEWGNWTGEMWQDARQAYDFVTRRDQNALEHLYPDESRYHRLRVSTNGRAVGWAVVLDTVMSDSAHFGDLRVGTVLDQLALEGSEAATIQAAHSFLEARGVDLIVSNQLDERWQAAFAAEGYLSATSNYLFATSPALSGLIAGSRRVHVTRGDGDGRIHL